MPLTGKYLKYNNTITYEIFEKIWIKLVQNGWKQFGNFELKQSWAEFKTRGFTGQESNKTFFQYSSVDQYKGFLETTVQEILGYDPFVKEFVFPEKWYVRVSDKNIKDIQLFKNKSNWNDNAAKYKAVGYEGVGYNNLPKNYTEITFDQFQKYVLKGIVEMPEVKEVIPEYVECIKKDTQVLPGMIYKIQLEKGFLFDGSDDVYYINNMPYYQSFFKPSTKEAFDAQNKPKQPLKQAVHCRTQEEWDFMLLKIGRHSLTPKHWTIYTDRTCWILFDNCCTTLQYCTKQDGYQILSFQEWCDLNGHKIEKEVKFEVGKWYKNLGVSNRSSNFGKFLSIRNGCEFWMSECIYQESKVDIEEQWLNYSDQTVECSLEEIQQYLPDNHVDKITPVIQQTRDMQKSNQEFKVDDYVIITKSNKNWTDNMDKEVGKIVKIISITSGMYINYAGKPFWSFGARDGHFRHATPEEINNHLISTGQIPAGEPLNTGIEPNKDGMFKYTTGNSYDKDFSTSIVPGPLKMTLSIDDEELPMINIIKTKTVNLLNLE